MEDRTVPAQLVWTNGTSDGLWNTAANWTDPLGGPSVVPGPGDYVLFGNLGSNTPCLMNASSATVDRIIMDGNYTSTFTLGAGNSLTTANQFVQYGDFIFGGSGALNVGGSLSIYGDVTNTPMMYSIATIDVAADVFLQTGGTITATAYSGDELNISALAFDDDGVINVGSMSMPGNISITGVFYQWNSAVTNVFGRSTLTFDSGGLSSSTPTIQGTINVGDASFPNYGSATIVTDTELLLNGGTLQTYQYGQNFFDGDLGVNNGGEIILGIGTSGYNELVMTTGSLAIGRSLSSSVSTAGTLTINTYSMLSFPAASGADIFDVAGYGAVDMYGGFISMNTARVSAMTLGGVLNSYGFNTGSFIAADYIFGSLINNATISFGSILHALNISVDYIQDSGASLSMRLDNSSLGDVINVGGTADLDGDLNLSGLSSLTNPQTWDLIFANSILGSFASILWPDAGSWNSSILGTPSFQVAKL
ncbi:MAG: hypothetical protein K2X38_24090 [Gemmataceae bacterium]|nr:hypothetical protein [Gemmataceae bacterium]